MLLDFEEFERWRWLRWAVERAPDWAMTDDGLLDRLHVGLDREVRRAVIREIERRVAIWPPQRQGDLLRILNDIECSHRQPGREAQDADRLLHRLLHQIPDARTAKLAAVCLRSPRTQRRRAAWRFYRGRQLDLYLVSVLAEQADHDPHPDLIRLVAGDADVLLQVDLPVLLERLSEFYWRGRILQTLLEAGQDDRVALLASDNPGEAIFAIRRAGRADLLPLVRELADEHGDDPEVLTGAIQAFGIFGDADRMLKTCDAGQRLLARRGPSVGESEIFRYSRSGL